MCVRARARACMCVYRQLVSGRDLIRASKALQPAPDAGPPVHITVDRGWGDEDTVGGGTGTRKKTVVVMAVVVVGGHTEGERDER